MTQGDAVADEQPDGAGPADETQLREALTKAENTARENWDKYLRAAADLDNLRKRAARDVEQTRRLGIERLAGDLLPVIDSLEMGLEAGTDATAETLLEGKRATLRLLKAALERAGVSELSPAGQAFDPQWHEALSVERGAASEPGSVVHVVQKGYQLHGRLLRPARVVVAGAAGDIPEAGVESGPLRGDA